MKSTGWFAVAVAVVALAVPAMAAGLDANAARAFVQKIYSHYPQKQDGPFFEPANKDAPSVFDPGMVAAFQEDARLAKGEVGYVDGDPICGCQDDSGMVFKITAATMTGKDTADVTVALMASATDKAPRLQTLKLVVVNGQWRIHDISAKDQKSYRDDLMKANARHAKGDWSHD